jgi:hypothetical protein
MDANDLNDAPDETVEEGQGHDRQASPGLLRLVKLGQGVSGPFKPRMTFSAPTGGAGYFGGLARERLKSSRTQSDFSQASRRGMIASVCRLARSDISDSPWHWLI